MPNKWIEHVKQKSQELGISYRNALCDSRVKSSYIPIDTKRKKTLQITPKNFHEYIDFRMKVLPNCYSFDMYKTHPDCKGVECKICDKINSIASEYTRPMKYLKEKIKCKDVKWYHQILQKVLDAELEKGITEKEIKIMYVRSFWDSLSVMVNKKPVNPDFVIIPLDDGTYKLMLVN